MLKSKAQSARKKRPYQYKLHTPPPDFRVTPGGQPSTPQKVSMYTMEQFAQRHNLNCTTEDIKAVTGLSNKAQRRVWAIKQVRTPKNIPPEADAFPENRGPKRVLTRVDTAIIGDYINNENHRKTQTWEEIEPEAIRKAVKEDEDEFHYAVGPQITKRIKRRSRARYKSKNIHWKKVTRKDEKQLAKEDK
ncbi:hypothetical protein BLS_004567 [Venturia inaequalis]|uniref:Uncharacterized protein n=1 Tax=Venturia inaequalis TaxID=5025 RepID=A0A8H3V558_VENIN|nr:hypothetical protein BLS_004567 [Venturia inaequalis]